jgi:hypothetical protein
MNLALRSAGRIAFVGLGLLGRAVDGQSLSSSSGASLAIATLTENHYDAGVSDPTTGYTLTTTCTGPTSAGCRLFIQYGANSQGQQVGMEYAVVSLTADCDGAVANPDVWIAVQPTLTVLSTDKNKSCVASFRFRASPLAWDVYLAPGPSGGAYRQQVKFVLTRP